MITPNQTGYSETPSRTALAANSIDRSATDKVDMLVTAGEGLLGKILRGPGPGKTFSLLLFVPAIIAFGISCYLAYTTLTASEVAGCGGGTFDCSHVLNSKYSKWMGVPVSILAAGNYLVMILSLSAICFGGVQSTTRKTCWAAIGCCGIAAGMAAIWFVGLQAFEIGHYCPWCLGAHTCGLVIATALLVKRPFGTPLTIASLALAGCGTTALIMGQVFAEEPPKFKIIDHTPITQESEDADQVPEGDDDEFFAPPLEEDGEMFEAPMGEDDTAKFSSERSSLGVASIMAAFSPSALLSYTPQEEETKQEDAAAEEKKPERRMVTVKGNLRLDPRQWPLLGSPDAKYIFVELYDYACPHCRATHRAIEGACEQMGDELAVIVLPVPLNTNCNNAITRTGANFGESCELARLAVACWRLDPAKFEEFHHWMFDGAKCPGYAQAKAKADELLGKEKVDAELRKESSGKYITKHVQLYKRIGKGIVPKLLFPGTTVEGEYTSPQALVELIRKRAG